MWSSAVLPPSPLDGIGFGFGLVVLLQFFFYVLFVGGMKWNWPRSGSWYVALAYFDRDYDRGRDKKLEIGRAHV